MDNHRIPMDHDACGVGFVTQLGGAGSHEVVERALEALKRLSHRGGVDADGRSGDGAGLLTTIPESFFRKNASPRGHNTALAIRLGNGFSPPWRRGTSARSD